MQVLPATENMIEFFEKNSRLLAGSHCQVAANGGRVNKTKEERMHAISAGSVENNFSPFLYPVSALSFIIGFLIVLLSSYTRNIVVSFAVASVKVALHISVFQIQFVRVIFIYSLTKNKQGPEVYALIIQTTIQMNVMCY